MKQYRTTAVRLLQASVLTSVTLFFASVLDRQAQAGPTVRPTGVTIYDRSAAYTCDLLFAGADRKTHLIDMEGHVVKTWDDNGEPARIIDPSLTDERKGVVGLQLAGVDPAQMSNPEIAAIGLNPFMAGMRANKTFGFVGWNGKVLWQWSGPKTLGAALQHHDFARLLNGNTLILSNRVRPLDHFGGRQMIDDLIYEVNAAGEVVWSWAAGDHLDELGFTSEEMLLMQHSPDADYLHVNSMSVLGPNHWEKSGDARFSPDNIMISSRNANFTVIIDHASGHIVWRIGPDYPSRNAAKPGITPRPIDQISGQHDPHLIPEGLPGAGNLLMFDNQGEAGYPAVKMQLLSGSRVLEINPATKQILWEYTGANSGRANLTFFSPFLGSVQRLPNGNTLIDEGVDGRFFQVTPEGRVVWEYISPFVGPAPQARVPGQVKPALSNYAYRVQGVPLDWIPMQAQQNRTTDAVSRKR